jgi:DNA-binding transcriptional ArsR family regulator
VLTAHFDADSVARVRLALSPVTEVSAWLGLTAAGGRHAVFGDPGAGARSALCHRDTALVAAVLALPGRRYTPDLLTPKPSAGSGGTVLDDQLERVAGTPHEVVETQVGWMDTPMPAAVQRAVDRGTFASRAAHGLSRFWAAVVADGWPGIRATMEADLAVRAQTMTTRGVGAMLESLHPSMSWQSGTLNIRMPPWQEELDLSGAELVCSPAVLAWPTLSVQLCDAADAALRYPADGIGVPTADSADRSLDHLLGATRAALLRDLERPRSTAALSQRHHLSAPTVSYHLQVLRRSGLVVRHRDGLFVLYQRTQSGHALVGP